VAKDRADREKEAREAGERERLKNMTEEERRQWERENPKVRATAIFIGNISLHAWNRSLMGLGC
jgi:hypothetical protein